MPKRTWLEPEEVAYTYRGSQLRKGRAIFEDGRIRAVYAGISDTYFTIPAHARINGRYVAGFLACDSESEFRFFVKANS